MWRSSGFLPSPGEDQESSVLTPESSAGVGPVKREHALLCVRTSGAGSIDVGARSYASFRSRWELGKAVRNTRRSTVHAEVKKMGRKTRSKRSSGQITHAL